ncbi:MAG: IclR family transcriptional regulator [Tissierellaceae bacterium]|nr:IclR family transcriptional regulator [Tissierellaceae bacterium]
MAKTGRVQAIDRAIKILDCFNEDRRELRLSEISDMLDINKSTVHGIISTLKFHGLIDQDEETQKYRLGLHLMRLGDIVSNSLDIRSITSPVIDKVCKELQETVHIGTLDDMEVVYINKQESNQSMRIFTTIGARNPAYCTGVGKSMLAYLDEEILMNKLPDKLNSITPKTITDKNELLQNLTKVKLDGYAFDDEENNIGLTCVAAPIFDHSGRAKYGISVSGPTIRMTYEKINNSIKVVKEAAMEISYKLGFEK